MKKAYAMLVVSVMLGAVTWIIKAHDAFGQGLVETTPPWSRQLTPDVRFQLVLGNSSVLDWETELTWEPQPDYTQVTWFEAHSHCNDLSTGNRKGWRLPTLQELTSLIDTTQALPALPVGHPFLSVMTGGRYIYWTATTYSLSPNFAWVVSFLRGTISQDNKTNSIRRRAWCVRRANGVDPQ